MYNINHNFTYRQKDKGWQVILSYKDGDKWRQKSKQGLKTKQQAKDAGNKLLAELQRTFVPSSNELADITLRDFIPIMLRDKQELALSSQKAYKKTAVFFDELADKPLRSITRQQIIAILNEKSQYAPKTKELRLTTLRSILNHARTNYGLVSVNPASRIQIPRPKEAKKIRAISAMEFQSLIDSKVRKGCEYYKDIVMVAYYSGMRYGEIIALEWGDIDFHNYTLTVARQIKQRPSDGKPVYAVGPLKTQNSYRTIPIPALLVETLEKVSRTADRVFPLASPYTHNVNQWIQRTLPHTSIHDMRHSYATNLIANGVDVQTVAALLGDTINTVINTYLDFTEDMRRAASDSVNRIFSK